MNTDKPQPLVTVYMPTYNRVELLQRAVDSVLEQDYRNIELIVVDDNSTDGTHEYLSKMADKDSRFKYIVNERNSGACVSRNKAIFAAHGDFITGLDDDDYFLPNHISSFVSSWQQINDNFVALYANNYIKNNKGIRKPISKILACDAKDLICSNCIGNQVFTKTSSLRKIGAFDENLPAWQDLECWYRLLKTYNEKAICIKKHSYVVDISHPHERISSGKIESIMKAFDYFCKKHNLSSNEQKILQLQLTPYTKETPRLVPIIKSVIYAPKPYNIKRAVIRLVGPILRKAL